MAFVALCTVCGLRKSTKDVNIRDFCGIGKFLRWINYDKFDEFAVTIVCAKASYNDSLPTAIKITVGSTSVTTETSAQATKGVQQTVQVDVPQGASDLRIEIIDPGKKGSGSVLAGVKVPIEDVIAYSDSGERQTLMLKKKTKKVSIDP